MSVSGRLSSVDGEPPRKRLRKGTKSCWECKRRKVRCQLSTEDVPVCSGCLSRGTPCLSQEYPPEDVPAAGGVQVGERLGRVERLLETLVAKITAFEEEEKAQAIMTPESTGNDVLTPFPPTVSTANPADNSPFLSLFDNAVIGRRETSQSQTTTPAAQSSGVKTPSCRVPKAERIRQALLDLLPSQQDMDLIICHGSSSLLIHSMSNHCVGQVTSATFNLAEIAKKQPPYIARTILYLAVCLQQLDHNFDTSRLHLFPSVEARIEKYVSTVQTLVTADDEMASTLEGIECLILQGIYQINAGNPRRAWLGLRRAMTISQLMGMHRKESLGNKPARNIWCQLVHADRYLALFLGLPAGSADIEFGPEDTFENKSPFEQDLLFTRKLCNISGRIIERNQSETTNVYTTTQEIDDSLDTLAKSMPPGWWEIPIPNFDGPVSEATVEFHRAMMQLWFFQLEAFLHLPYMLRAATERRYEYNKFTCLKSTREMVRRYLALRNTDKMTFCCTLVDFAALTAAVTLFLGYSMEPHKGESREELEQRESDRELLQTILTSMEELSCGGKQVVATQGANVIKSLLAVDQSSGPKGGNLKLTIPYFGTINIVRPTQSLTPKEQLDFTFFQPQPSTLMGQQLPTPTYNWQAPPNNRQTTSVQNSTNGPVISFTSSQFPVKGVDQPQPSTDWGFPEDAFYLDSMLSTDLDGNWILGENY